MARGRAARSWLWVTTPEETTYAFSRFHSDGPRLNEVRMSEESREAACDDRAFRWWAAPNPRRQSRRSVP